MLDSFSERMLKLYTKPTLCVMRLVVLVLTQAF